MTARIVVSCDGLLPSGMTCRGALPTREVEMDMAIVEVREAGWWVESCTDVSRCPSCRRRESL